MDSEYERMFVNQVLCRVDGFSFESLLGQMPFKDNSGKQRYVDFAIAEGQSVRIAIEVDGYDKKGRNAAMTRDEFVDWQRRETALVAQGWYVLRFANRDVRDHPDKCSYPVSLLLKRERSKSEHLDYLRGFEARLARDTEIRATPEELDKVRHELVAVRRQLASAEASSPLDDVEKESLNAHLARQKQLIGKLEQDASTMKTTIWAFATVVCVAIAALAFTLQTSSKDLGKAEPASLSSQVGASCDNPDRWQNARDLIGQRVALSGPVLSVKRRNDVKGKPTWITVGASFPDRSRLELLIWGKNRSKFPANLKGRIVGKTVCAYGKVSTYKGDVQIILNASGQLRF